MKMQSMLVVLLACILGMVMAEDFCVYYYKNPNYQDEAGFTCASVNPGETFGSHSANLDVRSFKAPEWLQVTLYSKYYWGGKSVSFTGQQGDINPGFTVHSVRVKNTKTA
ncbi:hypothetical protein DM01DRAFT_1339553 [Hesseltinella vesiculosa]|uniref:Secreted protein n=1 Tax=Hesseltinella vesiculosa TaxID=101127 RepID=A0A1X2G6U6_9FUNG|nr:hypothetical protein DM01DRAFT_1339553 [Hesseltinella vesiculosa]